MPEDNVVQFLMPFVLLDSYTRIPSDLLCQKIAIISSGPLCQKIVWSYMPDDLIFYARGSSGALWYSMTKFFLVLYDRISPGYLWMEIICLLCQRIVLWSVLSYARSPSNPLGQKIVWFLCQSPFRLQYQKTFYFSIPVNLLIFCVRRSSVLPCLRTILSCIAEDILALNGKYLLAFYAKKLSRLLCQMIVCPFIHEAHFLLEDNLAFHSRIQFGPL